MAVCIDTTGIIYNILVGITNNITGDLFLSTLVLSIMSMSILAACKVPLEYAAILLLPLHLAFLACIGTTWLGITGTILIYLGIILGKYLFFR